ncbi:SIR2 family protein [Methylobacterium currus]|uniref:SIR2 family protein n=1 Tax=Methylobacterium currus TaxID=2051553 RepID=UPI001E4B0ED5|nr:SIR2 family protein [Methylobacterium currus]UHC16626.1 SIR2 family protein [Methylobacterium currus]
MLLDRLVSHIQDGRKEIVFVVGSPLTAPVSMGQAGVANVSAITAMIRGMFEANPRLLEKFDQQIKLSQNPYQAAFKFLNGIRGQDAANLVIRQAVWMAHKGSSTSSLLSNGSEISETQLGQLENDLNAWNLSPGVDALGKISSLQENNFCNTIITSNFDPLIEVSIRKAGGVAWQTILHSDGSVNQSKASGTQIIHIHGYWRGSDTLHTSTQLLQRRPVLKNSLIGTLSHKLLVFIGYGGWDDILMETLSNLVNNQSAYPDVIWTFFNDIPTVNERLDASLRGGLDRGRVTMYAGIDCHKFFPQLLGQLKPPEIHSVSVLDLSKVAQGDHNSTLGDPVPVKSVDHPNDRRALSIAHLRARRVDCDRPPNIEAWVGRDAELRSLDVSDAKVVAICGIGGQGKSVLASKYLKNVEANETAYSFWDWRDCKEEGDRIRTQLIALIERITGDQSIRSMLHVSSEVELIEVFLDISSELPGVFVFDNVDNYVDLEKGLFVGLLDTLVRKFSSSNAKGRLIVTCRPQIQYDSSAVITFNLSGIDIDETIDLFRQRSSLSICHVDDIKSAHEITKGHAFWLDLIAVQVGRVPGVTLKHLLEDFRRGRGDSPDVLSSIWKRLSDREKVLLRSMAEIVQPETENMLDKLVSQKLNYQKFKKAIKALIQLNLVVVKRENNAPDLYDLHPLVRQFVRKSFDKPERATYIQFVLAQYTVIIKNMGSILGVHLPAPMIERWSQKVELEVEAGLYEDAFGTLSKAGNALVGGGHVEEFIRVARKLFESVDWVSASSKVSQFDQVLARLINCLQLLGEVEDVDDLMRRYEQTIPTKTARYIGYCNVRCHLHWLREEFSEAIKWGEKGVKLKTESDVDTDIDCGHNLALAKRDGGNPKEALAFFLKDVPLQEAEILADDTNSKDGPFFGNIGRCLYLIGDVKLAIKFYRRSARIIEDDESASRRENQCYARQWIAEAFLALGRAERAAVFFMECERLLHDIAPYKSRKIRQKIYDIGLGISRIEILYGESGKIVDDWIYGKSALL